MTSIPPLSIHLGRHVLAKVTAGNDTGVRAIQAVLESDPVTWAQLEGAKPGPDEAAHLVGEAPPGMTLARKHLWVLDTACVIDLVEGYPDATTWFLGLIFIAPVARNAGLGTELMRGVCDHVRASGGRAVRLAVVTTNIAARRLYDRLGFTHVVRKERKLWVGDRQECDVLELTL